MFLDLEIWSDVPGYEGLYMVSNYGKFKSFSKKKAGKLINGYVQVGSKGGYERFYLCRNNSKKAISGHVIVATIWVPNPLNLPEVNHIDNDRKNNYYKNLEWTDRKGNCNHAVKQGRYNAPKGEKQHLAKLKEIDVVKIRKSKLSQSYLSAIYNVHQSTISSIKRRETWKHI